MTGELDDVNQQHMAAMGLDPEKLGGPWAGQLLADKYDDSRCVSVEPHGGSRCVLQTGHSGKIHLRGRERWGDFAELGEENPVPTKQREGDQALPTGGSECVQDLVIAKMEASKRIGVERYGSVLMSFNGRRGIQDVAEEARDLMVYLAQVEREAEATRDTLIGVVTEALRATSGTIPKEAAVVAVDRIMGWVLAHTTMSGEPNA